MTKNRWNATLLIVALGASFALYGRSLGMAFVNDDIAHQLVVRGVALRDVAIASWQGSAYYRPLGSFAFWLILTAFGPNPPAFFAFSIALHGLNVYLLWHVARRLGGPVTASCAALAWLLFPTHFEAVAYPAALFHPLSTLLILLSVLAFDRALEIGSRRSWLLTGLLVLLAPFAHEQGVTLPALLLGWHALVRPNVSLRGLLRSPALYFVALVAPVLVLRMFLGGALTDAVAPSLANAWAGLQHIARLFAYPLAWTAGALPLSTGAHAGLGGLLVVLVLGLGIGQRQARLALFGLGWLLVTGAPVMLLLDAQVLPSSPRLFYLSSIGIVLLWCTLPTVLIRRPARALGWLRYAAAGLWAILVCLGPLPYIKCAMDTYAQGTAVVRALVAAAADLPEGEQIVFVNPPCFIVRPCGIQGPLHGAYPYDAAGVVVLPRWAHLSDLIWLNGGPRRALDSVTYAGYPLDWAPHGEPTSALALRRAMEQGVSVLVVDANYALVHDISAWWRSGDRADSKGVLARFLPPLLAPPELAKPDELAAARRHGARWNDLTLDAVTLDSAQLPGNDLAVALFWRPEGPAALEGMDGSLRLMDRYGQLLVEQRFPLLAGYGPDLWEPDTVYATRINVPVPPNAALGPARLELGLTRGAEFVVPTECVTCDPAGWALVGETLIGREQVVAEMDAGANRLDAIWENGMRLEGWLLTEPSAAGELGVILYWRAQEPVAEDLSVFVHLAGPDGVPLAQDDGEPVDGQFPTSRWPAGALVADPRSLRPPDGVDQTQLRLLVGLYRWPSLERLTVTGPDGALADHVLLGEIAPGR